MTQSDATIDCGPCRLRPWRARDADSLVRNANERAVWLNLRDRFPHPYTPEDARTFLQRVDGAHPTVHFAIEVDGEAVGGIGLEVGRDVERVGAEVGYWLGAEHWGRGLTTAALTAITRYAFEELGLLRVFALPYTSNAPSRRVLEKAGYSLEGTLRSSAIKDGVVKDQWLFARLSTDA
jgi:RimJ/RimL family protein N-acetyltransferase